MRATALVLLLTLTGCATLRPPPNVACRIVRDTSLPQASAKDLYQISLGTPAEGEAASAWAQEITGFTMGGVAAASLAAGLIMGFATDAATQPEIRNTGFVLVGTAGGMILGTLLLSYTSKRSRESARARLHAWSDRCSVAPMP